MAVVSPCVGICVIDPGDGYCRGCRRTLPEIARWPTSDDDWKRGVIAQLQDRTIRKD